MNTVKSTLVLKEHHPEMEVKVFYMDIRAFGKGFEDLYKRSRRLGVHYVRGLARHGGGDCRPGAYGWPSKIPPPGPSSFSTWICWFLPSA